MINKTSNSNINFTATRLYEVKVDKLLPNAAYKPVNAYFTKLSVNSAEDRKAVDNLAKAWNLSDYLKQIINAFKNDSDDIFCIETADKKPLHERIKAIMCNIDLSKYDEGNDMLASYLTADPKIQYKSQNIPREYKRVGEASVYGTIRLTKEKGLDRLLIKAENEKFFDKIGIKKTVFEDGEDFRYVPKEDFDYFLNKIENK